MAKEGKTGKSVARTRPATDVPREHVPEVAGAPSATGVAAEAQATGVVPLAARRPDAPTIPGQDEILKVGDPDDRAISNAFVGDETPGGDMPTPDQNQVDDIGRAYGVQEADSGSLRTSSEILDRRDQHRGFQEGPPPPARRR
jgi:hypothetical protein